MAFVETAPPSPSEQTTKPGKPPSAKETPIKDNDHVSKDGQESDEENGEADTFQDCDDGLKQDMIDPKILAKIDRLSHCDAGKHIDLPELVVVGGQSSGKSSVLEGLSKLPFPRKSGLCTRFTTRITFRRTDEAYVGLSIIPSDGTSQEYRDKLLKWQRRETRKLTKQLFASIMAEVHKVMGLEPAGGSSGSGSGGAEKGQGHQFSQDVLQIEMCGPQQQHFAIVDVPGIFHAANSGAKGGTTERDIHTVSRMVAEHMNNPRSVMLVVLPANVDPSTQSILKMAEQADPAGDRTLGVLTKPDLAGQDLDTVKELLDGSRHPLKLGWCVVMNSSRSEHEDPSLDRDRAEARFFAQNPIWKTVERESLGIASLKQRLREILADHIRREFPNVKMQVRRMLSEAEAKLAELGSERDTSDKQRRCLLDLCARFQVQKANALNADYSASTVFENEFLRLPTKVRRRNQRFAADVRRVGHLYELGRLDSEEEEEEDDANDSASDLASTSDDDSDNSSATNNDSSDTPKPLLPLRHFKPTNFDPEISPHICSASATIDALVRRDTASWLRATYRHSRGFELGTFSKSLLAITMKSQSQRWEPLALGYVSDVVQMVHAFICHLLFALCRNERVCTGVMSRLTPALGARYDTAVAHARFLARVELHGVPMTMSPEFERELARAKARRRRAQAEAVSAAKVASDAREARARAKADAFDREWGLEQEDLTDKQPRPVASAADGKGVDGKGGRGRSRKKGNGSTAAAAENVDATIRQLHDILRAYYHVARRRFIDNVCMQAAAHHLLASADAGAAAADAATAAGSAGIGGPAEVGGFGDTAAAAGPLDLFNSAWVSALSDEDLDEIAGEEAAVKRRRRVLGRRIRNLAEAWEILS